MSNHTPEKWYEWIYYVPLMFIFWLAAKWNKKVKF